MNICINNRDELHLIALEDVVYLKASGNFTEFHTIDGNVVTLLPCLSDYESRISGCYEGLDNPFFRAGRSYMVNTDHISSVVLPKQQLVFRQPGVPPLLMSKRLLQQIKQHVTSMYSK